MEDLIEFRQNGIPGHAKVCGEKKNEKGEERLGKERGQGERGVRWMGYGG